MTLREASDLPVIVGNVLIVGATITSLNLLIDVLYAVVDPPRARRPRARGARGG